MIRVVAGEYPEGVSAAYLGQRAADGRFEIAVVVHLDQMREHFGVGFALKDVAEFDQARAQRRVVLDDAVVNDGDLARAVHVRVGVGVRGAPVGRPAGMPHADRSGEAFPVAQTLRQPRQFAFGFRAG